ncbi:MAG: type II toxin-antitoxin system HicB family antitoxin [Candidatus Hodarchaeales archaeon]
MGVLKKDLKYYLNLPYTIRIFKYTEYNGEKYFGAEIPELPGCGAEGKTREEALKRLQEAKRAWIEVSLERGLEITEPKYKIGEDKK